MKKEKQVQGKQYLVDERLGRGWSQQEVADHIGTTPGNVSRWERGVTAPSPYFRQRLSTLFGKSPQELGLLPQHGDPAEERAEQLDQIASQDHQNNDGKEQNQYESLSTQEAERGSSFSDREGQGSQQQPLAQPLQWFSPPRTSNRLGLVLVCAVALALIMTLLLHVNGILLAFLRERNAVPTTGDTGTVSAITSGAISIPPAYGIQSTLVLEPS